MHANYLRLGVCAALLLTTVLATGCGSGSTDGALVIGAGGAPGKDLTIEGIFGLETIVYGEDYVATVVIRNLGADDITESFIVSVAGVQSR